MDYVNIPNHIGIIMDGNGRWAKKRGLSRSLGHKAGAENLKRLLKHIYRRQIKIVSIYAFSVENFKRDEKEVKYLMDLFVKMFTKDSDIFVNEKIKVVFSGSRKNLRDDVVSAMDSLEEKTKLYERGILNICFNYSGRREITDAVLSIARLVKEDKLDLNDITEELLDLHMYQKLPPLDFVIRTSGEIRISNFMLWESSYAEYYFPSVFFPDFDEKEFDLALNEYQKRKRRFGGV